MARLNDIDDSLEVQAKQISSAIGSLATYLNEMHQYWAKALDINAPQWTILCTIADLDRDEGTSVKSVANALLVDPSFVTTQSKLLEKVGLLKRRGSADDARIVLLSLTDKARKQMAALSPQQQILNEFVFADYNRKDLADLVDKLTRLTEKYAKASLKATLGL